MRLNKKFATRILTVVLILTLSNYVYAFSVGSAYHKDNPLKISPGESIDIQFSLQNMAGSENISTKVNILQSSELIELIDPDETYLIPVGGEKIVNARVTLPPDAEIGKIYPVEIEFSTITEKKKGTFGFGSAVGRKFNIIVTQPEEAKLAEEKTPVTPALIITLLVAIIIIAIVTTVILRKTHKKSSLKK